MPSSVDASLAGSRGNMCNTALGLVTLRLQEVLDDVSLNSVAAKIGRIGALMSLLFLQTLSFRVCQFWLESKQAAVTTVWLRFLATGVLESSVGRSQVRHFSNPDVNRLNTQDEDDENSKPRKKEAEEDERNLEEKEQRQEEEEQEEDMEKPKTQNQKEAEKDILFD